MLGVDHHVALIFQLNIQKSMISLNTHTKSG